MSNLNVYLKQFDAHVLGQLRVLRQWRSKRIRIWYSKGTLQDANKETKLLISSCKSAKAVEEGVQVDHALRYYEWDGETARSFFADGEKALFCLCRKLSMEFVILDSVRHVKDLFGFVDNANCANLPDAWYRFRYVQQTEQLWPICEEKGILVTGLCNSPGFQKAGVPPVKGAVVYRELSTGCYIHADTMHREVVGDNILPEHYEYYNPEGVHLGEKKSISGQLVPGTADPNKVLHLHD